MPELKQHKGESLKHFITRVVGKWEAAGKITDASGNILAVLSKKEVNNEGKSIPRSSVRCTG